MRIAITGSYGAGKTTLANRIASAVGLSLAPVPPMNSPLWKAGLAAVDCSREELIELLVRRLMDRSTVELGGDDFVSDGSLIHDWVFTRTLLMHHRNPAPHLSADTTWRIESLEPIRRAVVSRMNGLYDLVVHLPIEYNLVPGIHPVNQKFRELSDRYLCHELRPLKPSYITISGPLNSRTKQVLEAISHHK